MGYDDPEIRELDQVACTAADSVTLKGRNFFDSGANEIAVRVSRPPPEEPPLPEESDTNIADGTEAADDVDAGAGDDVNAKAEALEPPREPQNEYLITGILEEK